MLGKRKALAIGAMTALAAGTSRGDEVKIDVRAVPAAARLAAAQAAPRVRWTEAYRETEKDATTYELTGQDDSDRDITVEVDSVGRVLAVEVEIPMSQVPRVVLAALRARAQGFRPSSAEQVLQNGRLVGYEFEGHHKDGSEDEVFVSPDGRTVEFDDDDD